MTKVAYFIGFSRFSLFLGAYRILQSSRVVQAFFWRGMQHRSTSRNLRQAKIGDLIDQLSEVTLISNTITRTCFH